VKEESVNEGPDCSAVRNEKINKDENSNERWACEGAARRKNGCAIGGQRKCGVGCFGLETRMQPGTCQGRCWLADLGPLGLGSF
jgi:hypothetical protein